MKICKDHNREWEINHLKWRKSSGDPNKEPIEPPNIKPHPGLHHALRIMKQEFNVGKKPPAKDTCPIHESLNTLIKSSRDPKEVERARDAMRFHENHSKGIRSVIQREKDAARATWGL